MGAGNFPVCIRGVTAARDLREEAAEGAGLPVLSHAAAADEGRFSFAVCLRGSVDLGREDALVTADGVAKEGTARFAALATQRYAELFCVKPSALLVIGVPNVLASEAPRVPLVLMLLVLSRAPCSRYTRQA